MTKQTTVHIVVPPGVLLLDVAGPAEVLARAGTASGGEVEYQLRYVATKPDIVSSIGLNLAALEPLPDDVASGDIILIAGYSGRLNRSVADAAEADGQIVEWMKRAVKPGVRLVSVCAGALLAARAGLLNGFRCTTHHDLVADLADTAFAAEVVTDRLFVIDGERWTSAGVTSGIDLALHLVAEEAGPGVAAAIARTLVVYFRRTPADVQLSPWLEGRNHLHPVVHRAQDVVTADPARDWSVETLASVAGSSPRHFSRLFNQNTGMSVTDYVGRMRIALARQWLETTSLDMERVAERTGFGSARQLRRTWHRFYDEPPSHARRH